MAAFGGGVRGGGAPHQMLKKKIRIHFVVHVSTIFISFLLKLKKKPCHWEGKRKRKGKDADSG